MNDTDSLEPTVIDKPEHNYALYAYQPVNLSSDDQVVGVSSDSLDLVASDVNEDNHFIISILSTDLTATEEVELRAHLNQKLVKGNTGSVISSVTLQATEEERVVQPNHHGCYHRLLIDKGNDKKGFVICFLLKQEHGFELFQPDLDKYSQELLLKMENNFVDLETSLKSYLASWYTEIILYIERCLKQFGVNIQHIIYASLMDVCLDFHNATDRSRIDLQRFRTVCNLKEMLTPSNNLNSFDINTSQEQRKLEIDFTGDVPTIVEPKTSDFCQDWAETLLQATTSSPFCLRQIMENFKLKIIQDVNHLRRLLKSAEMDYYALFRMYAFLKSNGNAEIMLHQARSQTPSPQTSAVIDVVEKYHISH